MSSLVAPDSGANLARLFGRSFSISALVGVLYLGAVELAQGLLQYDSVYVHVCVTFTLYVAGIGLNYALQRNVAFKSNRAPLVQFFLYNFISATLVSALSGLIFSNPTARLFFGQTIESASIVLALLFISPVTFLVFRHIFSSRSV